MIEINGVSYTLRQDIKDITDAGIRHLIIVVSGRLKTTDNNLIIKYNDEQMNGIKILPHYDPCLYSTMFLVYVNG